MMENKNLWLREHRLVGNLLEELESGERWGCAKCGVEYAELSKGCPLCGSVRFEKVGR